MFINSDYQTFISQNLKVIGLLVETFDFFIPLGIHIEIDFHSTNTRIKVTGLGTLVPPKTEGQLSIY